jgi:phosphatidylglycerol---prolipoprotein diacylglyceryl transferase
MIFSYLIWNGSPEIFSIGSFSLRWYGLLFASGFLISQQILYHMFRKEGKPEKDVDTLTIYMIVATIIGARLGHIIFYQPEMLWEAPLSVILPFELSPFRFTGFTGLASHGGALGILFALWLYSRKKINIMSDDGKSVLKVDKRPNQNYLQTLDRIVILVALTGALIRMGNFFNSEIIGKPTNSPMGMVFINRVTDAIIGNEDKKQVDIVSVVKNKNLPEGQNGRVPIYIYIFFKPDAPREEMRPFMNTVKMYLTHPSFAEFVDEPADRGLDYQIIEEKPGIFAARVSTMGISRHPAQLYESISCVLLFAFLFWYWSRYKENLPEGRIFGYFMVILWTLRFLYEFLKENQESFENDMTLNMGQILSIPLVIVGIFILIRSFKQNKAITT